MMEATGCAPLSIVRNGSYSLPDDWAAGSIQDPSRDYTTSRYFEIDAIYGLPFLKLEALPAR
jgi:hypothetical protein